MSTTKTKEVKDTKNIQCGATRIIQIKSNITTAQSIPVVEQVEPSDMWND